MKCLILANKTSKRFLLGIISNKNDIWIYVNLKMNENEWKRCLKKLKENYSVNIHEQLHYTKNLILKFSKYTYSKQNFPI